MRYYKQPTQAEIDRWKLRGYELVYHMPSCTEIDNYCDVFNATLGAVAIVNCCYWYPRREIRS
jgi:hypothetical protein